MDDVSKKYEGLRVLLRQHRTHHYLQTDGSWSTSRDTARVFAGTTAAYYWALEQKLLGVEVLMAFADQQWDHVAMRV